MINWIISFLLFFCFGIANASPLIECLKGISFYDPSSQTFSKKCPSGIELDMNIPDEQEFIERMECFLGKPFSKEEVPFLKQEIVSFYQDKGYPVVGAFIPEGQSFSSGSLRVLILVGRLGNVSAKGAKYFCNETIASMFRMKEGALIEEEMVNEDLLWMNLNPFRTTTLVYKPGEKLGETDVVLMTKDRFPLRVYGGYENTGNPLTGTARFLAGFNWGNAFWVGHELNYLFVTETKPKNWYAHVAGYIIPLPWRDQLRFSGSYTFTEPSKEVGLKGKGWQLSGRYSTLFTSAIFDFTAYLGYEFKRTNNFVGFGFRKETDDSIDISQFVFGIDANRKYQRGSTLVGIKLYRSPGNMTGYNKTKRFREQREGAKSTYTYGVFNIDQVLQLPYKMSWALNSLFQASSAKLLPSEAFVLGGYYTVRGYDEFESLSDNGILLKNEIRSPALNLPTFQKKQHEIQFLAFLDFGVSVRDDPDVIDNYASILSSLGPALRYQFDDRLFVRIDWGYQLSHVNNLQTHSGRDSRLHIGAQLSF